MKNYTFNKKRPRGRPKQLISRTPEEKAQAYRDANKRFYYNDLEKERERCRNSKREQRAKKKLEALKSD